MTRMISISLFALFAIFLVGAVITALYIQNISTGYGELAELHRGEDIQRKWVINLQTVRSDLHTVRTPFASRLDDIVMNVANLEYSSNECLRCHHSAAVSSRIMEVRQFTSDFERALSLYITASADKKRIEMLKDEAVTIADQILLHTNEMLFQASNTFQRKNEATMAKISGTKKLLFITVLVTLASAIVIAMKLISSIRRPIRELLVATRSIASGNLSHRVSYNDRSDFGELTRNFNDMSSALIEGHAKLSEEIRVRTEAEKNLQKAYNEMEQRVDERTAEIKEANLQLRQEILERETVEAQLKASLEEKELLLKEIHHRVKNNMQVISSLLGFQSEFVDNEQYRTMFLECQNRIKAMSLIHEKLYMSRHLARIDFSDYIRSLAAGLFNFYGANASRISLKLEVADVTFAIDTAIPCGLIVNELVANCLKHAFPETGSGEIRVVLRPALSDVNGKDMYELIVSDNGIGLPQDLDIRQTNSLGLQIVNVLVEHQLQGTLELESKNGTEIRMYFKERKSSHIPAGSI